MHRTPVDHFLEAERLLDLATTSHSAARDHLVALAQAHATLATLADRADVEARITDL